MSAADEQYKKKLIERYVAGEASEQELQAFFGLLTEAEIDSLIEAHMDQEILRLREEQHLLTPVKRFKIWKYAAVITGFLLISYGGYYLLRHNNPKQQIAQNQTHDIAPGNNRATLTLAGGQKIVLTPKLRGLLATQGNTQIQAGTGAAITYTSNGDAINRVEYNTLTTVRGEQSPYPLVLADGTKVWLNAASSITFPTAFPGNTRLVAITGEAYFEVAHNAAKPFSVTVRNQTVQVLGTHFNINAYDDEPAVNTTLLEGRVKVTKGSQIVFLNPGQQAVNSNNGIKVQDADIDMAMAWKNGKFLFNSTPLESIMNQVSRWYDVDVIYQDASMKTKHFSAISARFSNVSELLHNMELTGDVKFKIEGKTIKVFNK